MIHQSCHHLYNIYMGSNSDVTIIAVRAIVAWRGRPYAHHRHHSLPVINHHDHHINSLIIRSLAHDPWLTWPWHWHYYKWATNGSRSLVPPAPAVGCHYHYLTITQLSWCVAVPSPAAGMRRCRHICKPWMLLYCMVVHLLLRIHDSYASISRDILWSWPRAVLRRAVPALPFLIYGASYRAHKPTIS